MKLTGDRNQCQACKEYFRSSAAFAKHRTGEHGVDRRCKTPREMLQCGMEVNVAGFWMTRRFDPTGMARAGAAWRPGGVEPKS